MAAFERLHPALQHQVVNALGWPSLRPVQELAIEAALDGANLLVLAPTAGGKTEAAFFPLISEALTQPWGGLAVLYISPIKALLNNQEERLRRYYGLVGRRAGVWHGDVTASEKKRILADPPDCLLTTPESLEVMLVSASLDHGRFFADLRAVVVDEVHAFARDARGWHLLALLQRIARLAGRDLQRIGLSATVGNEPELLEWLSAGSERPRRVIRPPSAPEPSPDVRIDYVGHVENAATVIAALHRGEKRLVFCDSRARVEKLAAELRLRDVATFVSHSSLGLEERQRAERAFSEGRNCVIVATALQERGIGRGEWLTWVRAVPAFRDLDHALVERVVGWMLDHEILWDDAGLLWLGREGQDTFGRKNFLDLISVFTAPPLFTVLHGRRELGFVDESTFLARREDGPPVVLLAGRAWRVNHLDWKRRKAHVEPAEDEGRSRWRGEGQFLDSELCRAIRGVLAGDTSPPHWSRRAAARMVEVRDEYPWLDGREDNALVGTGDDLTWWTFAGGRANAALASELARRLGIKASGGNFAVKFGSPPDFQEVERVVLGLSEDDAGGIVPLVSDSALDGLKFSECLPRDLAAQVVQARLTDFEGVSAVLGRPTRVITSN